MTVYLLFHPQDFGRNPMTYTHGDFWCSLFRIHPYIIESGNASVPSKRSGVARANSLAEAIDDPLFIGYTWVWLDHRADQYLHEYQHPIDNVVYVLGHDVSGFGDVPTIGDHVQVSFGSTNEVHASLILPLLCYDRHAYICRRGR